MGVMIVGDVPGSGHLPGMRPKSNLECVIGIPDLIVLLMNPVGHAMVQIVKTNAVKTIWLGQ
jgi:hypothetical protein